MTDQDSTATTTGIEIIQQTATGSSVTSSTSRGADFYFQCAVIVIGVVGTAANALILYAMVASKQHKKQVLIFNQNALDLVSCLCLVITYAAKLCDVYLTGKHGYWLCLIILSEGIFWCPNVGSLINLAAITTERYLKVVHPVWSKKSLRNWMIYSTVAFSWIAGAVITAGVTVPTTDIVDGACYAQVFWRSRVAQLAYGIWYFLSFYVIILLIFIFGYWRILIAIRRQATVMAGHVAAGRSTAAQTQSNHIQTNIVKTMILVSVFFAITWSPITIYYLVMLIDSKFTLLENVYYVLIFIALLIHLHQPVHLRYQV